MESGKAVMEVYNSPIKRIFDKFSQHKDVSLVYGKPIELEDKRVLPVAKVSYSVGGGGGYSGESDKSPATQGEGGGGCIAIKPVGVYEITNERVKFKPVIDFYLVLILASICTCGVILLFGKGLQNRSKRSELKSKAE